MHLAMYIWNSFQLSQDKGVGRGAEGLTIFCLLEHRKHMQYTLFFDTAWHMHVWPWALPLIRECKVYIFSVSIIVWFISKFLVSLTKINVSEIL